MTYAVRVYPWITRKTVQLIGGVWMYFVHSKLPKMPISEFCLHFVQAKVADGARLAITMSFECTLCGKKLILSRNCDFHCMFYIQAGVRYENGTRMASNQLDHAIHKKTA